MKKILNINKLPPVFKNQAGYFAVTFIQSALPLLFLPILSEYLTTAEYGIISLFNFYLSISNSLTGNSMPAFISKNFFSENKDFIARVIGNTIWVAFSLAILLTIILFVFLSEITKVVSLPAYWILALPLSSFLFIVFNVGLTVMRNENDVKRFGIHRIVNIFINVVISVLLIVVFSMGWEGRVFGIVNSYIASFLFIIYYFYTHKYLNLTFDLNIFRDIYKMLLTLIPSSLQTVLITQAGIFFIEYFYSKDLLGVYAVAFQISFSIKILFSTISLSWGPFLYKQMANKTNKLMIARYYWILFAVLIAGFLFVNIFSDLILKILVTEAYFGAKEFIPYLSLGFLFNGFFVLFIPIMISNNKEKLLSTLSFIALILLLVFNVVFSKEFGYLGVTYAFVLTYLFLFVSIFYVSQKILSLPWYKGLVSLVSFK